MVELNNIEMFMGQFPVKAWDYVVKIDDYYLGIDCTFFNILFKKVKE